MSNVARLRSIEQGLSGIAAKVLEAMSFADYKTVHEIGNELTRQGCRKDRSVIDGCLRSLTASGLTREWEGRYKRIQYVEEKTMHSVVPLPRSKPAVAPAAEMEPERAPELPDRMAAVAATLRAAASEVDEIAVAMLDREQAKSKEMEKLQQLKALLASIGGAG